MWSFEVVHFVGLLTPPMQISMKEQKNNQKAKYYVDVPVNPIYNTIGSISEQILKRKKRKFATEAQIYNFLVY